VSFSVRRFSGIPPIGRPDKERRLSLRLSLEEFLSLLLWRKSVLMKLSSCERVRYYLLGLRGHPNLMAMRAFNDLR
jgi:predicted aminopeptidase